MIVVVGLSHKTAPIAVREELALGRDAFPELLRAAVAMPAIGEAMLISTCNRVELVTAPKRGAEADLGAVVRDSKRLLDEIAPGVSEHLYAHAGGDAVRHLFSVACSLDSLVVGEPQILGQLKAAFELARATGTVGAALHRTVPRAIRAAKRVRTETAIGSGLVSVPSVAVDLSRQIFGNLSKHTVVLLGSGEMAETVAKLLKSAGTQLLVVGCNPERVAELAAAVGGEPLSLRELETALVRGDIVITSTSSSEHVVSYDLVHGLRRKRRGRSLFFIDLAVPRDVEPRVEDVEGVFLYNIDDFSKVVSESHSIRKREAERALEIVEEEARGYDRWLEAARVTPTLVTLRNRLRAVLDSELDKSLRTKLKHLSADDRAALEKMLEAALNKMLHEPTTRLREIAGDRDYESYRTEELSAALTELFALEREATSEPAAETETEQVAPLERAPIVRAGGR